MRTTISPLVAKALTICADSKSALPNNKLVWLNVIEGRGVWYASDAYLMARWDMSCELPSGVYSIPARVMARAARQKNEPLPEVDFKMCTLTAEGQVYSWSGLNPVLPHFEAKRFKGPPEPRRRLWFTHATVAKLAKLAALWPKLPIEWQFRDSGVTRVIYPDGLEVTCMLANGGAGVTK